MSIQKVTTHFPSALIAELDKTKLFLKTTRTDLMIRSIQEGLPRIIEAEKQKILSKFLELENGSK